MLLALFYYILKKLDIVISQAFITYLRIKFILNKYYIIIEEFLINRNRFRRLSHVLNELNEIST